MTLEKSVKILSDNDSKILHFIEIVGGKPKPKISLRGIIEFLEEKL